MVVTRCRTPSSLAWVLLVPLRQGIVRDMRRFAVASIACALRAGRFASGEPQLLVACALSSCEQRGGYALRVLSVAALSRLLSLRAFEEEGLSLALGGLGPMIFAFSWVLTRHLSMRSLAKVRPGATMMWWLM